jgi:hypothetical protein
MSKLQETESGQIDFEKLSKDIKANVRARRVGDGLYEVTVPGNITSLEFGNVIKALMPRPALRPSRKASDA